MTVPRPDPRAEGPDEKATVKLPAMPDWAKELTRAMQSGFGSVNSRLDTIEANLDIQSNVTQDLQRRVTAQDARLDRIHERQEKQSMRVHSVDDRASSTDLAHEANIAAIRADVEATKAKVDTVLSSVGELATSINAIVASPRAKLIAATIAGAILSYLASRGIHVPALP